MYADNTKANLSVEMAITFSAKLIHTAFIL